MNVEFSSGTLFMDTGHGPTTLGSGLFVSAEPEISVDESDKVLFNLNKQPSMSFEVKSVDLDLLNHCYDYAVPTSGFTLEYERPIMIQARWHKKARVRKTWLKRYGMMPDTVMVCADAKTLEYHPGHIIDERKYDDGVCATFDSFEFEANNLRYIWRPDQKRKGLKIEW